MSLSNPSLGRQCYHPNAYQFVFAALRYTQEELGRGIEGEQGGHISGQELLEGIRQLALQHFGMMTIPVFLDWGIQDTVDFGHIVFDLVDRGEMRKTDADSLADFIGVYNFEDAFDRNYQIDTAAIFRKP